MHGWAHVAAGVVDVLMFAWVLMLSGQLRSLESHVNHESARRQRHLMLLLGRIERLESRNGREGTTDATT